jgi:hypothetical protein
VICRRRNMVRNGMCEEEKKENKENMRKKYGNE